MSETVRFKGCLKEIKNPKKLSLEELCKEICMKHLLYELPQYDDNYQELLLEEKYNQYIILDDKLFSIEELQEIDPYKDYCHIQKNSDGRYFFETQFYNGGACLSEMLEENWNKKEDFNER